ncbi:MAG TPA: hypothetical protein VFW65_12295 [Pseudonocardiaceae bacterium]|nr:hypothetical protein [Pseudonocardiaceae bacterium]
MEPTGQFARRFPLVARPRPACVPLTQRVADLCDRARRAQRSGDLAEASAVHNQAALVASDCALPDLARQWCHRQANVYLRAHPLGAQVARHALEPLTNLARLYIREGQGERAFDLMDTLFAAVSSRAEAVVDGVEIPADLTDSEQAHQEIRRWLWAVLLATGARALAVAGRWTDARDRLRDYKGIGRRMLDGRQVEVIAAATSGDSEQARALLDDTAPGEPWENAVTACLTVMCRSSHGIADTDGLLAQYYTLDTSSPGLMVFRTRLGLSFVDAIGGVDDLRARRIAVDLIDCTAVSHDGYVARDVLAHNGCRELLTGAQEQALTDLVEACALGCGAFPAPLLTNLTAALSSVEEIMARKTIDIAPIRS